jgi:hypothetical protein
LPDPLAPDVTDNQELALLAAVQLQPEPLVTPTLPVPPAAAIEMLAGDKE